MGVNLEDLPELEEWVNITEAAEILGISRQYAYRLAARTNDGLKGGWQTIRRIGTKAHYVISAEEVHQRKQIKNAGGSVWSEIDLEVDEPEIPKPSARLINAQSWWIAAELVRRHPQLIVHESHPGRARKDVLSLLDERDPQRSHHAGKVEMSRTATLLAAGPDSLGVERHLELTWGEALSGHPARVVEQIEHVVGFATDVNAPSPPRVLVYEFFAELLLLKINSSETWDIRNEVLDHGQGANWFGDGRRGYIEKFPILVERSASDSSTLLDRTPRLGLWNEPYSHYWAVLRDKEPVLLISPIEGIVFTREESFQLSDGLLQVTGGMQVLVARTLIGIE